MKYRARAAELEAVEFRPPELPPEDAPDTLPSNEERHGSMYDVGIVGGVHIGVRWQETPTPHWQLYVHKSDAWCDIKPGDFIAAELDGTGVYPIERATFEKRWFKPVELGDEANKLLSTMDAAPWAKAFSSVSGIDEGWALTWFANAIMAGYDAAKRQAERPDLLHGALMALMERTPTPDERPEAWEKVLPSGATLLAIVGHHRDGVAVVTTQGQASTYEARVAAKDRLKTMLRGAITPECGGPHLLFSPRVLCATLGLALAPGADDARLRIPVDIKGWDVNRGDVVALIHQRPDGSYLLTWQAAP